MQDGGFGLPRTPLLGTWVNNMIASEDVALGDFSPCRLSYQPCPRRGRPLNRWGITVDGKADYGEISVRSYLLVGNTFILYMITQGLRLLHVRSDG
jgi:hypothetical protein